jgi:hypothetical protein
VKEKARRGPQHEEAPRRAHNVVKGLNAKLAYKFSGLF